MGEWAIAGVAFLAGMCIALIGLQLGWSILFTIALAICTGVICGVLGGLSRTS